MGLIGFRLVGSPFPPSDGRVAPTARIPEFGRENFAVARKDRRPEGRRAPQQKRSIVRDFRGWLETRPAYAPALHAADD